MNLAGVSSTGVRDNCHVPSEGHWNAQSSAAAGRSAAELLNVIIKLKGSAGQCAPCSPEKHPVPKSVLSPQRQQQAAASELANAMEHSVREELRLADTLEKGVEMLRKLIDERAELKSECTQPESL